MSKRTDEAAEADDGTRTVVLCHDSLGWRSVGRLRLMTDDGGTFSLGEARVNGPFAVGRLLRVGDGATIGVAAAADELPDDGLPWAVAHIRSGALLGLWEHAEPAEIHADTVAPLRDWSDSGAPDAADGAAEVVAAVPALVLQALRRGASPCDPRFPRVVTVQ